MEMTAQIENQGPQRLQKVLAQMGICSRRKAEELILAGRISVNGAIVQQLGTRVDPTVDRIRLDGILLGERPAPVYILLNKPAGWITSAEDERGRRTVLDLLSGVNTRCFPVGRLDYNTSGLLLLTNDGELANQLLHPSKEVEKTYLAEVPGKLGSAEIERLKRGVLLEDGPTAPAKAKILGHSERNGNPTTRVEITIHEGRNRQVRRMLAALGFDTIYLKRTGFAFLRLGNLPLGQWRYLDQEEIDRLKKLGERKALRCDHKKEWQNKR